MNFNLLTLINNKLKMAKTRSKSGVIEKKSYKNPSTIKKSDLPSRKVKFRRMKKSEKKI